MGGGTTSFNARVTIDATNITFLLDMLDHDEIEIFAHGWDITRPYVITTEGVATTVVTSSTLVTKSYSVTFSASQPGSPTITSTLSGNADTVGGSGFDDVVLRNNEGHLEAGQSGGGTFFMGIAFRGGSDIHIEILDGLTRNYESNCL